MDIIYRIDPTLNYLLIKISPNTQNEIPKTFKKLIFSLNSSIPTGINKTATATYAVSAATLTFHPAR